MNPYLKGLRDKYEALKSGIEGLQNRAVAEKRDLTAIEMQAVKEQGEQAKGLLEQIEALSEIETRNAKVAGLQAALGAAGDPNANPAGTTAAGASEGVLVNRAAGQAQRVGGAQTQDRDPGHYRSAREGGRGSFFADLHRSATGDHDARKRLEEHARALDSAGEGVGIVPPRWLQDEYEPIARQGRALANAVRNIPLGNDPRPITLPKQTVGASTVVAEQANENDPIGETDQYDSDVDTVSPKATSGKQIVSRQLLDMASPAIDFLIYGDLVAEYNRKVELKVGTAIRAVGTALAATKSQFHDMETPSTNGSDLAVRAAVAVRKARTLPADLMAMTIDRWGEYLQLKDATGRPLMPAESAGPVNVVGVGTVATDGRLTGARLAVVASDGMEDGNNNTDTMAAVRASDVLLFESDIWRFRFEEQKGPESIVLGIWAYTAVAVRRGTESVKRVVIDLTS